MLEFSKARKPVRPLQPKQTGWTARRSLRLPAQPPARSRPRSAPGPQPLLDSAAITHTKTPCVSALGDEQLVAGTVPEQGRESALAPNPLVPHAQHIFHGKAIPLFPGLNMGVPSAAHNAHPHRNQPLGAGAPDRGAQAARQKFALSPAGGAKHPSARLLGRPISRAAERGGSSTTRSPLVQSTTCLGLHLVTGSMVSDFTARWARKSAAEWCSPRLRLSPARPGRPLKPAWPRLAGHPAAAQPGERGPGPRRTGQLCPVSAARPAAVLTRRSVIQLLLGDLRSCGSTAATSDSRPGLSRHGTLLVRNFEVGWHSAVPASGVRPRRGPHSACAGAPSLPASRSHLLSHRRRSPGRGRTQSVRARVAKFQLCAELRE